jgi:TonB family protein
MTKALLLSFLCHTFAFAGSFFLLGNSFSNSNLHYFKEHIFSVSLESCFGDKKQIQIDKSIQMSQTSRKAKKKVVSSPKNSGDVLHSWSQSVNNSSIVPSAKGDEQAQDGAANLTPHPLNEPPIYPEKAREQGLVGKITLQLTIDQRGRVVDVKIIEGHEVADILQNAAILAVKKWKFSYKNTPLEKAIISLPVVFSLET